MARAERKSPLVWLMPLGTLLQFMLPRWAIRPLFPLIGSLVYLMNRRQRGRAITNLRHIMGSGSSASELHQAARQLFSNLVANSMDLLRVPVLRRRNAWVADFDSRPLDRALKAGRGAVLVTAHIGNWDLAGVFLAARGYNISAVVEPIPRGWTQTFNRYRGATAMETFPIPDHRAIARALERNRLLALVADRDLTGRGLVCPAFDASRSYPRGPAAYALRYGKPLVVGCLLLQSKPGRPPYRAWVSDPIEFETSGDMDGDVDRLTRIVAQKLNAIIAHAPEQWLAFQAGWQ